MTIPLANSVDWIGRGHCHLPKNCYNSSYRTAMTMATFLELVDRIRSTESSRSVAKASKRLFFTVVTIQPLWKDHSHSSSNRRENDKLTLWSSVMLVNVILTTVLGERPENSYSVSINGGFSLSECLSRQLITTIKTHSFL